MRGSRMRSTGRTTIGWAAALPLLCAPITGQAAGPDEAVRWRDAGAGLAEWERVGLPALVFVSAPG